MLGRNKEGIISAGIISTPLNLTPLVKNDKTLYIDSIAVDKKYRGNNIGKKLLEKTINSTGDKYNDVFLVSYKESENFYSKQGFTPLRQDSFNQNLAVMSLAQTRGDYPKYATFMNKSINNNEKRWYNRNLLFDCLSNIIYNKFKSLLR